MKLSVIIAYYNAEKYIFPLLESLLDLGFQKNDYEIIVVDDGSPNDVSRLKEFCDKSDTIRYVRQENARASAARNNGIKIAKGDYIYCCDNDDMIRRQVLSRAYEKACENNLDILFFNRIILNENETPPPPHEDFTVRDVMTGQQYYGMKPDMSMGHWSYLIKKSFIETNALEFPLGVINVDDVAFALDALVVAQKVGYIDTDVYYWIQRPQSLSHYLGKKKMSEQYNNEKIWFVKKYKNIVDTRNLDDSCVYSIKRQIEIQKFS